MSADTVVSGENTTMSKSTGTSSENNKVIDFTEARAQKMEDQRRKTERVFINNFLGVYCVTGDNSMKQIEMVDLSDEGCTFQIPVNRENPWPESQKEFPIRLYFSQESYLQIYAVVQNTRNIVQNGTHYKRFGCAVDPSTKSFEAYQKFVAFLKAYTNVSQKDDGDVNVFFV